VGAQCLVKILASLGSENTYNATTNSSNLSTASLSRGNGIAGTALGRAFAATGWSSSTNTKANAISTNQYFQFSFTANSGKRVSLTALNARLRRSGAPAPNAYIWRYSTNGSAFTDIGTDISFTSTADGVDQTQIDLSSINALQNVAAGTTITFRLYAWGGNSTLSTFSIGRFASNDTSNSLAISGYTESIPAPVITSSLTASGKVGTSLSYNVTASNTPSSYSATGLPTGLSINATTGLISGTPTEAGNFDVTIGATNAAGTDAKTLVINIAKGDQTITFEPLSDKLDSVGTFTLSATSNSGLDITYTSSNTSVLTIVGNVATVLAPGTTTITASQAGDDNYNAATDVSQDQKIVDSTITVWDGTAWSNGEPTSSLKAILDGDYDGSSFESQTLTVNTGKTLTVNSFVKTGNVL
jgi:hypothetical protein